MLTNRIFSIFSSRNENQIARDFAKCFGLGKNEIQIENGFARDMEGERA